jgi:hypothetical protein
MGEEERVDTTNPKHVRAAAKREEREVEQRQADFRAVLATPEGRRIFTWLIFSVEGCALNQTSFHSSGQQFAANEGRRGVGVQLQAEIMQASLEDWIRLVREHQNPPKL